MGIVRRAQGARRKAMSVRIVDDEQRRDRPQDPCALRVAAAGGRLRRCGGSTMCTDIACATAPSIRPPGARNAAICTFTTDCRRMRRRDFLQCGLAAAAALVGSRRASSIGEARLLFFDAATIAERSEVA